jgi:predicted solute-binding protein
MPAVERAARKLLGVPHHVYTHPLWWLLKDHSGFQIQPDDPAHLAIQLRRQHLHGALLSPIDYARDYAVYRIIPHVAVSSRGKSNTILLTFAKGLRSIRTIAVHPASASEIVLTHVVLAEKYDIHPTFVPIASDTPQPQTDARLFVGDPISFRDVTDAIDIVDEWTDMSNLPYVHSLWVSRPDALTASEIAAIVDAGKTGGASFMDVISRSLTAQAIPAGSYEEFFSSFAYSLDEEEVSGLTEFLRMAYYHGILNDIADVKMHTMVSKSSTLLSSDSSTLN